MFNGYDWAELLPIFGVEYDIELEEVQLYDLQECVSRLGQDDPSGTISQLREFLAALVKGTTELGYSAPLFEGLALIEDAQTFCKYFSLLLPEMWT